MSGRDPRRAAGLLDQERREARSAFNGASTSRCMKARLNFFLVGLSRCRRRRGAARSCGIASAAFPARLPALEPSDPGTSKDLMSRLLDVFRAGRRLLAHNHRNANAHCLQHRQRTAAFLDSGKSKHIRPSPRADRTSPTRPGECYADPVTPGNGPPAAGSAPACRRRRRQSQCAWTPRALGSAIACNAMKFRPLAGIIHDGRLGDDERPRTGAQHG